MTQLEARFAELGQLVERSQRSLQVAQLQRVEVAAQIAILKEFVS